MNQRRQWHPTPVLLPGKSHGQRSLEGCGPWGRWGLDMTEGLHFFSLRCIGEGNGNPLQCSCLENCRDGGAWGAAVYGVAQSRTWLKRLSSSSSSSSDSMPHHFSSVQFSHSVLYNSLRRYGLPSFPVHHWLLELTQTHVHWVGDATQPSHPLLSPSLPAFNLSSIRIFSNESVLRSRWPKYWRFSFSISPFNEYSELISFRIDWLDLLAVQWTLKSLLQHHNPKASICRHLTFFIVQLSHPYVTTGKAIAWTI